MKRKIVSLFGEPSGIFSELNEQAQQYAAGLGFDYEWHPQTPFDKEKAIGLLARSDAGIIDIEPYDESVFREIYQRNRLLVRFGVGYDKVDLAAASRYGIAISRTAGANTLGVAEMALTLILTCRRLINTNQDIVRSGVWTKAVVNETIGSTVGIVGFGAIGQALAGLLRGFNCRIIAYDPYPNVDRMNQTGVEQTDLDTLFSTADAISIHVPYNAETHHLVNAHMLVKMKPSAIIVNTSRGNIIDEWALFEALSRNQIRGAGLDVFGREPLPLDSPLLKLGNIVLTPHASSQTMESLWRIYKMAIDISADFFNGNAGRQILNPDYAANCVFPRTYHENA